MDAELVSHLQQQTIEEEEKEEAVVNEQPPLQQLDEWFKIIDPIREQLHMIVEEQSPPTLLVIGNEDSGKSTLLDAFLGMEVLPKKAGVCTAMAIEFRLRRSNHFRVRAQLLTEGEPNRLLMDEKTDEREEIAKRLGLLLEAQNESKGKMLREKESLLVEYFDPIVPTIDLIDLPGMMLAARNGFPEDSPQKSKELTSRFIRNRSGRAMILMVVDANSQPIQSVASQIVYELGMEDRTIGVLTRCDRVHPNQFDESIVSVLQLREGAPFRPLRRGYFATVAKKLDGEQRYTQSAEVEWFNKYDAFHSIQDRIGMSNLTNQVLVMFNDYAREQWFPCTLNDLHLKRSQEWETLKSLGLPTVAIPGRIEERAGVTVSEEEILILINRCFENKANLILSKLDTFLNECFEQTKTVISQRFARFSRPCVFSFDTPSSFALDRTSGLGMQIYLEEIGNFFPRVQERFMESLIEELQLEDILKVNRFEGVRDVLRDLTKQFENGQNLWVSKVMSGCQSTRRELLVTAESVKTYLNEDEAILKESMLVIIFTALSSIKRCSRTTELCAAKRLAIVEDRILPIQDVIEKLSQFAANGMVRELLLSDEEIAFAFQFEEFQRRKQF